MLKVNDAKLLADYNELVDRQRRGYLDSEEKARAFAVSRNYDEKKTADFIKFVVETEKGGLTVRELQKLEHLSAYVEEIPDEIETETINL